MCVCVCVCVWRGNACVGDAVHATIIQGGRGVRGRGTRRPLVLEPWFWSRHGLCLVVLGGAGVAAVTAWAPADDTIVPLKWSGEPKDLRVVVSPAPQYIIVEYVLK